ncbi:MAG: hypothetical protein CMO19_03665 [Thaumarchaeota archaeon]|nr:hypothetical protein [Nitrososphaerota archaeon]|tara:strand:+ start:24250 stop:24624 length:375 start_codon:yes stop_codon:yes gene_type:complete
MSSVSKISIKITIGDIILDGEISKHLAPTIVNQIFEKKRLSGPIIKIKDLLIYSPVGIIAGLHKPKKSFKKEDIGFLASNGAIVLFRKDQLVTNKMTVIGNLTSEIEKLDDIKPGEIMIVEVLK